MKKEESLKIGEVYYVNYLGDRNVVSTAEVTRVTVKDSLVTIRIKNGYHGSLAYGYKGNNTFIARWGEYYSDKSYAERVCDRENNAREYSNLNYHCRRLKSFAKELGVNITIGGVE